MAFRWNDTVERMLLIKVIEQNSTVKFDATDALASWPQGVPKPPNKRSLGDRFTLIKRQIREQKVGNTVGMANVSSVTSTPSQAVPATPRARSTQKSNKKVKIQALSDDDDDEEAEESPTRSKATQQKPSTRTHTPKKAVNGKATPNARKRKAASESAEESLSASEAETLANESGGSSSENEEETHPASNRRVLPRRSKTPATYVESDSEGNIKKEKASDENRSTDSNADGDDGLYDPVAQRINDENHQKRRIGWMERKAAMFGHKVDLED